MGRSIIVLDDPEPPAMVQEPADVVLALRDRTRALAQARCEASVPGAREFLVGRDVLAVSGTFTPAKATYGQPAKTGCDRSTAAEDRKICLQPIPGMDARTPRSWKRARGVLHLDGAQAEEAEKGMVTMRTMAREKPGSDRRGPSLSQGKELRARSIRKSPDRGCGLDGEDERPLADIAARAAKHPGSTACADGSELGVHGVAAPDRSSVVGQGASNKRR